MRFMLTQGGRVIFMVLLWEREDDDKPEEVVRLPFGFAPGPEEEK